MACCILVASLAAVLAQIVRVTLRLSGVRLRPAVAWRPTTENSPQRTALARRLASFAYARDGIVFAVRTQANMRIHLVGAGLVAAAGIALRLQAHDWLWLTLAVGAVLAAETMNTAIEQVCDLVSPGPNDVVKHAKDLAAGAVLITAIMAAAVGLVVFGSAVWAGQGSPLANSFCV